MIDCYKLKKKKKTVNIGGGWSDIALCNTLCFKPTLNCLPTPLANITYKLLHVFVLYFSYLIKLLPDPNLSKSGLIYTHMCFIKKFHPPNFEKKKLSQF